MINRIYLIVSGCVSDSGRIKFINNKKSRIIKKVYNGLRGENFEKEFD